MEKNKEPWDYRKFVECYNDIAMSSGGWLYEEKTEPAELKADYEESGEETLRKFAESLFIFEQRF